jgi:predicted nucleotidyltransferase
MDRSNLPERTPATAPVSQEAARTLSAADRRVAATLKRRLERIGRPVDFRVFGSRARGDATWESDLDIFIELEAVTPAARRRIDELAWEVGFAAGLVVSPFVVTREDLESGPVGASPLIQYIMAEGIVV